MEEGVVIKIATQGTKGEKSQRISIDDISTYRPWLDDDGKAIGTMVVLKGSTKPWICEFEAEKLDELKNVMEL